MTYRLSIYYYRYSLSSPRRAHAPSRWVSELALSVGTFQKMRRQDPLCCGRQPLSSGCSPRRPSPASTPNKACSGRRGFVAVFERFLALSFSVAHVGSHPPPPTLTVGPPRHIRAYIEYYNAESHSCANPDGFANRFSVWLRRTAHRIRMPCITNPAL